MWVAKFYITSSFLSISSWWLYRWLLWRVHPSWISKSDTQCEYSASPHCGTSRILQGNTQPAWCTWRMRCWHSRYVLHHHLRQHTYVGIRRVCTSWKWALNSPQIILLWTVHSSLVCAAMIPVRFNPANYSVKEGVDGNAVIFLEAPDNDKFDFTVTVNSRDATAIGELCHY